MGSLEHQEFLVPLEKGIKMNSWGPVDLHITQDLARRADSWTLVGLELNRSLWGRSLAVLPITSLDPWVSPVWEGCWWQDTQWLLTFFVGSAHWVFLEPAYRFIHRLHLQNMSFGSLNWVSFHSMSLKKLERSCWPWPYSWTCYSTWECGEVPLAFLCAIYLLITSLWNIFWVQTLYWPNRYCSEQVKIPIPMTLTFSWNVLCML